MAATVNLGDILHDNCISCSGINQFALAMRDEVKVIEIECTASNVTTELTFTKYGISTSPDLLDVDVGISRDDLKLKDGEFSEILSMRLDKTLWPVDPLTPKVNPRSFCKVSWSPKGCDHHQRCLLACLQSDHRLIIFGLDKKTKEMKEIVNISERLLRIRQDKWPSESYPTKFHRFVEYRKRKLSLAIVGMAWSSVMPDTGSVLLATTQRDGSVLIWQLKVPFANESDVTIATTIESGFDWPTALAWLGSQQEDRSHDLLAIGSRTGEIALWCVGQGSSKITAEKLFDLWPDKDEIPVNNLCWIPCSSKPSHYFLLASKGQHFVLFLLSVLPSGDVRFVAHCTEVSPHLVSSSGLCSGNDFAMSCCQDGSLVKITPLEDGNDVKMDLVTLESHPPFKQSHRGCALSASGIYLAVVTCNPQSRKHELELRLFGDEDLVYRSLTDIKVPLSYKSDSLEWMRCHYIKSSSLEFPQLGDLAQWVDCEGPEGALYRIQLKRYLLIFQSSWVSHRAMKLRQLDRCSDDIKNLEKQVLDIQELLMTFHLCAALRRVTKSDSNDQSVQMIFAWHSTHQTSPNASVQKMIQEAVAGTKDIECTDMNDLYDVCNLCGEKISFQSLWEDSCSNGHTWRRCSLTLLLCQTKTSVCSFCGKRACAPEEKHSQWIKSLLKSPCIFCGGIFLT